MSVNGDAGQFGVVVSYDYGIDDKSENKL